MSHRAFDGYTSPQTANGIDGKDTVIRAQSSLGTGTLGGDLVLTSGSGTTRDGYVRIGSYSFEKIVVGPDGVDITDATISNSNLTKLSDITFDGYEITPTITQEDMPVPGTDGYHLTVKAQNSLINFAYGGDLLLQSGDGYGGDGYSRDGYVKLYAGSNEQMRIETNFVSFLTGQRINIADVGTTPFTIPDGYYVIMVNTSTSAMTIYLPPNPIKGDTYQIKDVIGNAGANNITINGNSHNIDGGSNYTISTNYGSVVITFSGSRWSVL